MGRDGPGHGHRVGIVLLQHASRQQDVPVRIHDPLAGGHESTVQRLRERDQAGLAPAHATVVTRAQGRMLQTAPEPFGTVAAGHQAEQAPAGSQGQGRVPEAITQDAGSITAGDEGLRAPAEAAVGAAPHADVDAGIPVPQVGEVLIATVRDRHDILILVQRHRRNAVEMAGIAAFGEYYRAPDGGFRAAQHQHAAGGPENQTFHDSLSFRNTSMAWYSAMPSES